jgi:uncharacterized membrane protein
MSQNRAQKKDRLKSDLDYQVSLKSEMMLQQLHVKFDEERAAELQAMQEKLDRQLTMLEHLLEGADADSQSPLRLLNKDQHKKEKPL